MRAASSVAWRCSSVALAFSTCALAMARSAVAACCAAVAVSRLACAPTPFRTSSAARARSSSALCRLDSARCTVASCSATLAVGDGEARFLLAHPGGEGRRLDAGEHLALLHFGGEIGVELADIAGELRADLDGAERAHGAGGRHHAAHVAARRGGRLHVELGRRAVLPIVIAGARRKRRDQHECEPTRSHGVRIPESFRS